MNGKRIASVVLTVLLGLLPEGCVTAALDEGNFVPANDTQTTSAGVKTFYHSVESGDTLWGICQKYRADLNSVRELNGLNGQSVLAVGQKLQIPGNMYKVHIVKKGETLWDIARNYSISVEQLMNQNQGIKVENLKIGMSLALPDNAASPRSEYIVPSRSSLATTLFSWPIVGAITSAYGWRSTGFHHGTDISAHYGDAVQAAAAGRVSFVGYRSVYGKTIIIAHSDGSETLYAHLSQIMVSNGQKVKRCEVIGAIGTTGNSTGPHLHFEVRKNRKYVNPVSVLR